MAPATIGVENEVPLTCQQVLLSHPVMRFSPGATMKPAAATPALLEKLDSTLLSLVEPTPTTNPA